MAGRGAGIHVSRIQHDGRVFPEHPAQRCFITDLPDWAVEREIYLSTDPAEPLKSYAGICALLDERPPDVTDFRIPPVAAGFC